MYVSRFPQVHLNGPFWQYFLVYKTSVKPHIFYYRKYLENKVLKKSHLRLFWFSLMLFIIFIVVKMRDLSTRQINHRKMDINYFWSIIVNLVKCTFGFFRFYFNFLHILILSQQNCKFVFRMDQTTFCICELSSFK